MESMVTFDNFENVYKGKTVLITGHTGFKGAWLSIWLKELGANVVGYSLEPYTDKDIYVLSNLKHKITSIIGDIRDKENLQKVFEEYKPEYVFHLAAQPLVIESYINPVYTYETNIMGTINILECIRNSESVKVSIIVTSDKCYENKEQFWGYREIDNLGGFDPYSASKGATEIIVNSYRHSFMNINDFNKHKKSISSVRAGNVIGGGDWQKNRIVPDCIKSIENDRAIYIRNPHSVRPWQHVLEPLRGYILLGERMTKNPQMYSGSFNFAPNLNSVVTVEKLANLLVDYYGKGNIEKDTNKNNNYYESKVLNLDISKSYFMLDWYPKLDISQTVKFTVDWYKNYNCNVYDLCVKQIENYIKK